MNAFLRLLALTACLLGATPLRADVRISPQPADLPAMPAEFRQGMQAFRQMLHQLNFKPLTRLEDLSGKEENKLLIVLGDTSQLDKVPDGLDQFLKRGGAVLIASDRHMEGKWQELLGMRIRGEFVRVRDDLLLPFPQTPAVYAYRELLDCPLLRHTLQGQSPLFRGDVTVATNRPSYLERRLDPLPQPGLTGLAVYPPRVCVFGERPRQRQLSSDSLFAAGGDYGKGRVLLLADHSVFINEMMLQQDKDNDNILFAANCIQWVCASRQRTQVLFLEDGSIQPTIDEPLVPPIPPIPPIPPLDALIPMANQTLRAIEDDNYLNKLLGSVVTPQQFLIGALAALTLVLAVLGFIKLGKKRHRVEREAPRLNALLTRQGTSAAVVEQRHQAMLDEGNLWEAARALARQCFDAALGQGAKTDASRIAAEWGEPPRVYVVGGWWKRWTLGEQVRRLWQLAYDPVPVPVSPREFARLPQQVRAVQACLADGTVRIEQP